MIKINIDDKMYPKRLKDINEAPKELYLEGNTDLLNSHSIAIVGSRKCSENGQKLAEKFATELSTSGITIVSGLALGIDSIAHISSYDKKGRTIAVLGCGLNKLFPEENFDLYKKILDNNGLIVTEYPLDEEAKPHYFLERNRIVSGLSLGLLVVEALYRSGTSVTAKKAMEQGRKVFTVPHEIWDSRGIGTNRLLKKGAILVTDTSDILFNLKLGRFHTKYLNLKKEGFFDEYSRKKNNKQTQSLFLPENSSKKTPFFSDTKQSIIYETIKESKIPLLPNDIAHKTDFSINEILSVLFLMEVDGNIKKSQGGYVCI